jgi:ESS family glutamate:Na+ symporter
LTVSPTFLEFDDSTLRIGTFLAVTFGIVVLFIGKRLNGSIAFLREFSIPEPVSGGLLVSLLATAFYAANGISIEFELSARDLLLVYFFTTIGINASVKDLLLGGKPLLILLVLTIAFMFVQDAVGVFLAGMLGEPPAVGLLGGTISLIGGHGTAIAWAPRIAEGHGVANAMEIGLACATLGLILASLMGGPIARFLIARHGLQPSEPSAPDVGVPDGAAGAGGSAADFLDAILAIHVCILIGVGLNAGVERLGLDLPLFVTCLFAGILMTNVVPRSYPRVSGKQWPNRTPAMAVIADIALGTFLAMSLMSLKLWTLIDMAGAITVILAVQFVLAVIVDVFVIFRALGKNYDAAVIAAGFGGIALGSTPTAMANMSAVTMRYGASHLAFIIVPLVCAFFIDLVNALLIPFFLARI